MDQNFNRAIKQYSQCIDLQPEDFRPYYRRGRAYYHSGDNRLALLDLERSIALNPTHIESYNYIITILDKSGEREKASIWQTLSDEAEAGKTPDFARFDIVLPEISTEEATIDPDQDYDQLLEAADKNLLDQNYNRAIKQYSECVDLQPDEYRPVYRRGQAYYYSGNSRLALEDFEKTIALNPEHIESYNYMIAILIKSGDQQKAEIWQARLEEVSPEKTSDYSPVSEDMSRDLPAEETVIDQDQDYHQLMETADKHLLDQNYNRAIKQYSQCMDLQPDDYRPVYRRGRAYYYSGNNRSALEDFEKTIALNPAHIEAYNHVIAILNKSGELEKAEVWNVFLEDVTAGETPDLAKFDSILQVVSADRELYSKLIMADQSLADDSFQEAIELYSEYIDSRPADYRGYSGRAQAYKAAGKASQSLSDFERTLDLNPTFWQAYTEIIQLLNALGEKEEAESYQIFYEEVKNGESLDRSQRESIALAVRMNRAAHDKMESWLKKDEFESSSMYRERTTEPNKKKAVYRFQNEALNEIAPSKPEIQRMGYIGYNADKELFTVENEVFEYITMYVPIERARSLKDELPGMKMTELECEIKENYELSLNSFVLESGDKLTAYHLDENTSFYKPTDVQLRFREVDIAVAEDKPAVKHDSRGLALVIGNAEYRTARKLLNPENDAQAMSDALKKLGFEVMEYQNLDLGSMRRAIDDFGYKLRNYDVGLFFYAGHGIQAHGANYLIPVDASLLTENDVDYNCVKTGRLLAKMEDARNPTNIIILDACRDNPFERSWTRSASSKGLAFMNAPSGSLIAYATSPGFTASDGTGENGLYTSAILRFMFRPDQNILEMFQEVRRYVKTESKGLQIPWETTSLEGNFYLVPEEE
jgi:tetratricopeptide (TPR) repeat protein